MVKSDEADTLESALRREGQSLLQTKRLTRKTPVTPLQLIDPHYSVDSVLLSPDARVAVLTDAYGQSALRVSELRPHWNVAGWVNDTKTFMNLQNLATPANLVFDKKPKTAKLDAILAVSWAHQFLSDNNYHVPTLLQGVQDLLAMLNDNGQLLIQDFYLPEGHDKFAILDIAHDEAADALIEFSLTARPHAPKALQGFFMETLPAPRHGIQRFRLPMKWAVEFYHRWRHGLTNDAPFELTTLSLEQWSSLFEQCGARVTYQAPHFLSRKETRDLKTEIYFFDEQGRDMPLPPSSFTLLVEKIATQSALQFYERRPSADKAQDILISGIKNTATDETLDIVETRHHEDDVLPWYRDNDGRLHVLIRTAVARPIINAVARGTPNLDGRLWAGYLIEPLTVPHMAGELNTPAFIEELQKTLPFSADAFAQIHVGAEYYPAPDFLVQRVRGITVQIDKNISLPKTDQRIADVLASDVLRALSIGLIPDGKLEILIGTLMAELGETPTSAPPFVDQQETIRATKFVKDRREVKVTRIVKSGEYLMDYIADKPTETLRAVRSVFVEDQMTSYGRQIADYIEHDFIVPNTHSANTAVCIPLTNDPIDGLMMSGEPRTLPIPQRMGTGEPLIRLPSFSLPSDIKTIDDARLFLAKQLRCDIDDLHVMGPSFFVQPQISAERVYPFLLTAPANAFVRTRWFKPRSVGLQRRVDRHVDKTAAYIDFKFARDYGEFYKGFSAEIVNHLTQKMPANTSKPLTASSDVAIATEIMNRHPSARPKF